MIRIIGKSMCLKCQQFLVQEGVSGGFTTSEYFCKFFRDNTGMTPSEFRIQPHRHKND